jgi:hypothetical protein
VLVALALVLATMPRWERHSHATGDHDHAFVELHAAHHAEAEAAGSDSAAAADPVSQSPGSIDTPHAHQVASSAVALPIVAPLKLASLPPESWPGPQRGRSLDALPSGPPHRPPIA